MAIAATKESVTAQRVYSASFDNRPLQHLLSNLEQSVQDGMTVILESPLIPSSIPLLGVIFDVQNSLLTEVA